MPPTWLSALVPLLSVLLGAGMTYLLNVRALRRNAVNDLFQAAISAVAVADASKSYIRQVSQPENMSTVEYANLLENVARSAVENHMAKAGEAREAIARVLQYEPRVADYYRDAEAIVNRPDELINLLREAQERVRRSRRQTR